MKKILFQGFLCLMILCVNMKGVTAQDLWGAKVKRYKAPTLRGYIFLPQSGESIYLQQSDSSRILLKQSDIRKLKLVNPQKYGAETRIFNYEAFATKPGFYHQIFVGASVGEEQANMSLGILNGYRFNKLFGLDLGINYDRYQHVSTLPVYLQPKLYLKNGKVSIYYFTGIGYSPAWRNSEKKNAYEKINVKGGPTGHAGIGYQVNFSKSALNFALGYKLQKIRTHYEYFSPGYDVWYPSEPVKTMDMEEKRVVRRIFLTVGYTL